MDKQLVSGDEQEPLISRGTVMSIVTAAVGIAVAFGVPITAEQKIALAVLAGALAPLVLAWWARRHVNSPASTKKVLDRR